MAQNNTRLSLTSCAAPFSSASWRLRGIPLSAALPGPDWHYGNALGDAAADAGTVVMVAIGDALRSSRSV